MSIDDFGDDNPRGQPKSLRNSDTIGRSWTSEQRIPPSPPPQFPTTFGGIHLHPESGAKIRGLRVDVSTIVRI